jgi:lysozyme family protein
MGITGDITIHLPHLGKNVIITPDEPASEKAIAWVLAAEGHGGDPNDPGGATNWGWTLSTLKTLGPELADFNGDGVVDLKDLEMMTAAQAANLYKLVIWDKLSCDRLDPGVACVLLDSAVNLGPARAVEFLQQAFNALPLPMREYASVLGLEVDGVIGPKTVNSVMAVGSRPGGAPALIKGMLTNRLNFYRSLLPGSQRYYDGWLNRLGDLQTFVSQACA